MHIYTHVCEHIYIYIYTHTHTHREIQRAYREGIQVKTPNYIYTGLFSSHN